MAEPTASSLPAKRQLLDRVRELGALKHYSERTVDAYVGWIRRFIVFHNRRHPGDLGVPEVNAFLSHLATANMVSALTQNQALAAILFLYSEVLERPLSSVDSFIRAKCPKRLPVVLTRDEVSRLIGALDGACQLMASLLYGSGLRVQECVTLRVKDIDPGQRQIIVRRGKGQHDRVTVLPESLIPPISAHLREVRALHYADLKRGAGEVVLPEALRNKYPNAASEWKWQWVFPATRLYVRLGKWQTAKASLTRNCTPACRS